MARILLVQEGAGTVVVWKYPGQSKYVRFPVQITEASINSMDTASIPTTHLGSRRARQGIEFGGQTSQPAVHSNPGMFVITGFFDPSVILPDGVLAIQVRYLAPRGWFRGARYDFQAYFTTGSLTMPMGAAMTRTGSMQLSGFLRFVRAQRTGTAVITA